MARKRKTATVLADEAMEMTESQTQSVTNGRFNITMALQTSLIYLGVIFFIVWILIGFYFIPVLYRTIKTGQYALMAGLVATPTPMPEPTPQTEADLSGIGRVNIACVQQALSSDALQKVIQERSMASLNEEDKKKFEACVVAKETASPAATPSAR